VVGTLHQKIRSGRVALAAVLVLSCAFAPSAAFAAKNTAKIKSKKATEAAIITELDRMKIDLQLKADDLAETNAKIKETQAEVDQVAAQLAEVQASVLRSHQQLSARAASLYRSDRIGMVEMLLGARNIEDLIVRTHYLTLISQRDAQLLNDYRLSQSEGMWLQESLNRRMDRLSTLQAQSDKELKSINAAVSKATAKALQIHADIAALLAADAAADNSGTGGGATGTRNNPNYNTLISSANFRSQDMTTGAVQTFLSRQPGILDSYSTKDHNGNMKTAAQIIVAAGHAWNISPRVILITLQKEQSLLTLKNPTAHKLEKAMGVGYFDSGTVNQSKYAGFGNQIWYAAKTFDANAKRFSSGDSMMIDGKRRHPTNSATWSLYRYTPHIAGNDNFWRLWWTYFDSNPTGGIPAL